VAVSGRGVCHPDQPVLHADDEGFLRGRAAFETLRVYGGRPFRLREHLERLGASTRSLGVPEVASDDVEGLAWQALRAAGASEAYLRLYVTPGREGRNEPVAMALVGELPPDLEERRARGIALCSVPLGLDPSLWLLAGIKSTSYALNMVAVDEARRRGGDDAVFLGAQGVVLEGPTTNIWWRSERVLFTPSLDLGILAGVTRSVLIEVAPSLGYGVEEGAFPLSALAAAEEAFTSSSVREVMPVIAVDGAPIGDGRPGAAAAVLQGALRRIAKAEPV
jgi:branched-subunit amino acid aminotransferase/4-amino-4-deoxychorismate lyase